MKPKANPRKQANRNFQNRVQQAGVKLVPPTYRGVPVIGNYLPDEKLGLVTLVVELANVIDRFEHTLRCMVGPFTVKVKHSIISEVIRLRHVDESPSITARGHRACRIFAASNNNIPTCILVSSKPLISADR
jgi:hypothetical protein